MVCFKLSRDNTIDIIDVDSGIANNNNVFPSLEDAIREIFDRHKEMYMYLYCNPDVVRVLSLDSLIDDIFMNLKTWGIWYEGDSEIDEYSRQLKQYAEKCQKTMSELKFISK